MPKLFLYALKVIDYKTHGKVVCTAPRITPLLDNSTRISEELGVPIKMLSNLSSIKIKTNNFYVQYKYKDDFHTKNTNHGFIKISTDGTLLMELKNNLTLFQKVKDKFINTNIYDILFIDEAHEHNTNMDLILTLARQTCYLNNTIRLIIVSATMDDDEPIYRQYFNNINDKLIFPIKHKFHDPVLQKDILINSNYMDRRYHISPPGETVQYNINEIYQTWKASNGDLAEVHRITLEVSQKTNVKKFLWPTTWMFQCVRLSGAKFISDKNRNNGFGEIQNNGLPKYEPLGILDEIGHNFWSSRQPDGYSEKKQDWVSTEHFDRRIRIASRIYGANPSMSGEEIAEIYGFSDRTKMSISTAKTSEDKFIVALCSPELMEV